VIVTWRGGASSPGAIVSPPALSSGVMVILYSAAGSFGRRNENAFSPGPMAPAATMVRERTGPPANGLARSIAICAPTERSGPQS